MRRSPLPLALAGALCATPLVVSAQRSSTTEIRTRRDGSVECFRDDRRVDCESLRSSDRARAERERRAARERELTAMRRAEDARRRAEEVRRRDYERETERMRAMRRSIEASRARARATERRYRDDLRPRVSLGGGADMRRFDDVNRYLGAVGVDFHTRFGLGLRPEVMYAWTDRQRELLPSVVCPQCSSTGFNTAPVEFRSRAQAVGVNLNATYSFLRGSPIRPYLLGGVGVLTTREAAPIVASSVPVAGSQTVTQLTYRTDTRNRTDFGLNAGAGLEFGRGPVRLFTEFRYFLSDTATPRGFSGMLPITAGLRF